MLAPISRCQTQQDLFPEAGTAASKLEPKEQGRPGKAMGEGWGCCCFMPSEGRPRHCIDSYTPPLARKVEILILFVISVVRNVYILQKDIHLNVHHLFISGRQVWMIFIFLFVVFKLLEFIYLFCSKGVNNSNGIQERKFKNQPDHTLQRGEADTKAAKEESNQAGCSAAGEPKN